MPKISDELLLKFDGNYPRYTSYPTAPHFTSDVNAATYKNWLTQLPDGEKISLYFHIPFCQQMCWYCGCFTKITQRYAPVEDYIHIVMREVRLVADLLKNKNHQVAHIHFGGGSPTILQPNDFAALMQTIRENFAVNADAEIAIEIDPRTVNEEKISTYAKCGVNRASLGVQDFNEEVQIAINRLQSFDLVYDCIKMLRAHNINEINLDLIYGLPKQTVEDIARNIDFCMLLKPNRIALFAYAHVQWMKKHMRLIDEKDLPDSPTRLAMYAIAAEKLQKYGYAAIGLDHFAKPDDSMAQELSQKNLKRNFQGYSTDEADSIISFGASSIGYLSPFGYVQNTLDFDEYKKSILGEELPIKKGIATNAEDRLRKKIIDQIMCYFEVDLDEFCADKNHFAKELQELANPDFAPFIHVKNNKIEINKSAPQMLRVIASIFDSYFKASAAKHSKVT